MAELWQLPGPARWLRSLVNDRDGGRSGVVMCPSAGRPAGLVDAMCTAGLRSIDRHVLDPHDGGRCAGASAAADAINLSALTVDRLGLDCSADPAALAINPSLGRVSLIVDARSESLVVQAGWIAFAETLAAGGKELPRTTRPTMWVLSSPVDGNVPALARSDVGFGHRWWWGSIGPVDAVVSATDAGMDDEVAACATEVVRWDLDLLDQMSGWDGTASGLAASQSWWPPTTDALAPPPEAAGATPRPSEVAGWSAGLVESWSGVVVPHIALETRARAQAAEVRIWSGQVARVLPFIELERWRLAEWLAAEVATTGGPHPDWATSDIEALEIGPLYACLRAHRRVSVPSGRTDLVRDLKDARNAIAHRRSLTPATIKDLRLRAASDRRR